MKIVMGSILNFQNDINGVIVSCKELMCELSDQGHEVQLVTPYDNSLSPFSHGAVKWTGRIYKKTGLVFHFVMNLMVKFWIILTASWKRRNHIDAYHAHDMIAAIAFLIAAKHGQKILLQTHFNGSPQDEFVSAGYIKKNGLVHRAMKTLFTRVLLSERIELLAVSEYNKQVIMNLLGKVDRVPSVLYPGIPSMKGFKASTNHMPMIINVGGLDERKNQVLAIDLLIQLKKLNIWADLHFVGPEEAVYKRLLIQKIRANGVDNQVHFHGQQSIEKTRNLIRQADLYLHTAKEESFGRSLVEAISSGTPVISYDYPAVREILQNDAIIDGQLGLEKNTEYLRNILTNPEHLIALRDFQYTTYQEKFTPQKMIQVYERHLSSGMMTFNFI